MKRYRLADLRVADGLFRERFAADCDTRRCVGRCCRSGVWLDPAERDRVLAHAPAVQAAMDPGQARNPRRWFSVRAVADADFPSGRAVHTRVRKGRCVFLNGDGRCVLQRASLEAKLVVPLKPFFCTAFPITLDQGVLTLDDKDFRAGQPCCDSKDGGPLSVFETCREELRHVVGEAGVRALRRIALRRRSQPPA